MIYSQELKDRTFKAYEEDVSNGVVRQRELEEKVLMYYRRTTPSLQEYYSRYTPEWEAFYSSEHLPDMAFLQYLKQMRGAFKKRYELAELNIDYYISLLENASLLRGEGARTKEFFLDKWHQLLTRKEYDYQYMHINSLCEGFDLLIRKQGKESGNKLLGSRMEWLLHNYNPQIQISAESETKRSIFREKDKTKRSKKESAQHSKSRNKSFVMTSVSAL